MFCSPEDMSLFAPENSLVHVGIFRLNECVVSTDRAFLEYSHTKEFSAGYKRLPRE